MIYDRVEAGAPLQQGDIFRHVPRVDLALAPLVIIEEDEQPRKTNWSDLESGSEVVAVLPVKSVMAVVVTQNCDARRGEYITLCQIDGFLAAIGQHTPPKNADKWQRLILTQARTNHRLFYLPTDERFGIKEPLAVDFRVIIRVPRDGLEQLRGYRAARLNEVALDHFRESFSHFFRRYAYNEWYPLTKEEFEAYAAPQDETIDAYPWQKADSRE